jgi:hypothetical protein
MTYSDVSEKMEEDRGKPAVHKTLQVGHTSAQQ